MVLTETEKQSHPHALTSKSDSKMKVSPNSPVAWTVIEDKVIDMLLFLSLRHFKLVSAESEVEKWVTFDPQPKRLRMKNSSKLMNRLIDLMKLMVFEMHSYETPLSPFVREVLDYLVRLFVGEESGILLSDKVLQSAESDDEQTLQ